MANEPEPEVENIEYPIMDTLNQILVQCLDGKYRLLPDCMNRLTLVTQLTTRYMNGEKSQGFYQECLQGLNQK